MGTEQKKAKGIISEVKFHDPIINKDFEVKIGEIYTTISIGNRYYYFNKEGLFDGTSHDCNPLKEA